MKTNKRSVQMHADTSEVSDNQPIAPEMAHVESEPAYEDIAVVAHQIYEEAGCPIGFAEEHWAAAESSLRQRAFSAFAEDGYIRR
jgi:hypothetical protein